MEAVAVNITFLKTAIEQAQITRDSRYPLQLNAA